MAKGRPVFDPNRVAGPRGTGGPRGPITVTQLTALVRGVLTQYLPSSLQVVGELSNVSQPSSGHLYFTLKDEGSEVRAVMWRSAAGGLKFEPEDGMQVIATGQVDVYEPRGQYQLYVRKLEPRGVGALELAFRQLREKLEKEGLFAAERKKALPRWPRRIGVVTSATGAAIRDVLKVLRRRYPCASVYVMPVRVQGEGAAAEIADAVKTLNRHNAELGLDVLIVGRGGGSLEDLWAFNEEVVARAIFASAIPVVSAVGHEVDVSISDLVADVRAPTPSAAAEMVVPVLDDVLGMLADRQRTLRRHVQHGLEVGAARLETVSRFEWFRDPLGVVARRGQVVDEAAGRLIHVVARRLDAIRRLLHRCEVAVSRIRPDAVVHRKDRQLLEVGHRLGWALSRALVRMERRLAAGVDRLVVASPEHRAQREVARVEHLDEKLRRVVMHRLAMNREQSNGLAGRLEAVGHKQVLRRGFSITRAAKGRRIIKAADQVKSGDKVVTETAEGEFESRVLDRGQGELFE
jgi:exodeoxyribonuclease VII large subunit